jgi:hypothetical protein
VDATTGNSFLWKAGGNFYIGAGVNLSPYLTGTPVNGQTWKVIEATQVSALPPDHDDWTFLTANAATQVLAKWR